MVCNGYTDGCGKISTKKNEWWRNYGWGDDVNFSLNQSRKYRKRIAEILKLTFCGIILNIVKDSQFNHGTSTVYLAEKECNG